MHTRCDFCSMCGVAWCMTTWLGPASCQHTWQDNSTMISLWTLCLGCWKNCHWISEDVVSAWWCTYALQPGSMPASECLIRCAVDRESRSCSMACTVTWPQPAWFFSAAISKASCMTAVKQEDLQPWNEVACDRIRNTAGIFERVCQSLMRHCQLCIEFEGWQFEQLLQHDDVELNVLHDISCAYSQCTRITAFHCM
jgi:hypothetical protein